MVNSPVNQQPMVSPNGGERLCPPGHCVSQGESEESLTEWPWLDGSGRLALPALGS